MRALLVRVLSSQTTACVLEAHWGVESEAGEALAP